MVLFLMIANLTNQQMEVQDNMGGRKVKGYIISTILFISIFLTGGSSQNSEAKVTENSIVQLAEVTETSCKDSVKLEQIELNKKYQLDVGDDGEDDFLLISTDVSAENWENAAAIILNNTRTKVDYPSYDLYAYLIQTSNGVNRVIICGGIGNDYGSVVIYDLSITGAVELYSIPGFIREIDKEKGLLQIRDRKFLLGLQFMNVYYYLNEKGDLIQDGNYNIDTDSALSGTGFTLIKDMRVFLYDENAEQWRETILNNGEKLISYETDMKSKIFFLLNDNTKGYIEMEINSISEEYYVGDIELVDYFDQSEFQWAG